jgi:tetratricopeptide (TPR) repeat protein
MSRGELKENLLAARVEKFLRWAIARRGPILISVVLVIAAVLIGSVVVLRRQQARETVETQMAIAQSMIMQQHPDQAVEMLQAARSKATDSFLASRLLYIEGTAYLATKNFDGAVTVFREALELSSGSPLQPLVLANLGFAQEEKKDYDGAAATYTKFMTDYGNHFLAPRIQLSLGRTLFAAGKSDDARKALGQLIDLYPTSVWAQNARDIMGRHK